jgi:subtilisin family serine protease
MPTRVSPLFLFPLLVTVAACSNGGGAEERAATPISSLERLRSGQGLAARSVVPAVTPRALDTRAVRAVVELTGEPITVIQAGRAERKLSLAEREAVRSELASRQDGLRQAFEAGGGKVLRSFQNAYNGVSLLVPRADLARLAQLPGVVAVHPLQPKKLSSVSPGAFVSVPGVWAGTAGLHGEAIKVAVIDTGIDYTHANFGGPGSVDAFELAHATEAQPADPHLFGPGAPRVKGGVDLVGDAYDASSDDPELATPHPDSNPLDCEGHGSHVAGIVGGSGVTAGGETYAGAYDGSVDTLEFRVPPGIAPRVELYAVRAFGCSGETLEDIDAIEWAVDQDMDVINLSFGADIAGGNDPTAVAASNAVKAGVVVVAAAGNAGPGAYVASSPANGDGVIAVAALDAMSDLPAAKLDLAGTEITVENVSALPLDESATYPIVVLGTPDALSNGCAAADYARSDVPGALVVELRGSCFFDDRATLAQAAGAAGILLVNNVEGYPPFVGLNPLLGLPFFGVLPEDAERLVLASTATATSAVLENPGFRSVAEFSSSGPRLGDSALKPNVIAPGVGVISTAMGTGSEGLALSGTSMASPVVTGVAALVRQAHPSWRALDIANTLVNTAEPGLVADYSARRAGTGVPRATAAVKSSVVADSAGTPAASFGFIELERDATARTSITLRNLSSTTARFDVASPAEQVQGFPHTLALPASVTVPAHGQARLDLRLTLSASSPVDPLALDDLSGMLELTPATTRMNEGVTLRVPYYGVVKPEARLAASAKLPTAQRPNGSLTLSNARSNVSGTAELYTWGIEGADDHGGCNDVRAVGVESLPYDTNDRVLVFAVNSWRRCSSASSNEYDVAVVRDDGSEYLVVGVDAGLVEEGVISGELGTLVMNLATGEATLMPAVASPDSGMVYLVALASELGLSAAAPRFSYAIQTSDLHDASPVDAPADVATFNAFQPALLGQAAFEVLGPNTSRTLPFGIHPAAWRRDAAKGLMLVFAENAKGAEQAELFPVARP